MPSQGMVGGGGGGEAAGRGPSIIDYRRDCMALIWFDLIWFDLIRCSVDVWMRVKQGDFC